MVGVGIAWASTIAMPYSILAGAIPKDKRGVYMGVFNFFITIPEILSSLFLGKIMQYAFHNNRILGVVMGGVCLIIAALFMLRVEDVAEEHKFADN